MIRDSHHNAVLLARLKPLVSSGEPACLIELLRTLSNAQFRTAGYLLGEELLANVSAENFLLFYRSLIAYDARAFLVTLTKCFVSRIHSGVSILNCETIEKLSEGFGEVDKQKFLQITLREAKTADEVCLLFNTLCIQEPQVRVSFLIKENTLPCMFVLFKTLRHLEHEHDFLVRVAYFLIKRGDSLSFNMACLIKEFFGLNEVKNTFSLRLKPYQLARLELSYAAFCEVIS